MCSVRHTHAVICVNERAHHVCTFESVGWTHLEGTCEKSSFCAFEGRQAEDVSSVDTNIDSELKKRLRPGVLSTDVREVQEQSVDGHDERAAFLEVLGCLPHSCFFSRGTRLLGNSLKVSKLVLFLWRVVDAGLRFGFVTVGGAFVLSLAIVTGRGCC